MDRIAILDFGGQTTQLIGRRLREGGYYAEIFPGDSSPDLWRKADTKGVIFQVAHTLPTKTMHPLSILKPTPKDSLSWGFAMGFNG
jgi:hypothetical protein